MVLAVLAHQVGKVSARGHLGIDNEEAGRGKQLWVRSAGSWELVSYGIGSIRVCLLADAWRCWDAH